MYIFRRRPPLPNLHPFYIKLTSQLHLENELSALFEATDTHCALQYRSPPNRDCFKIFKALGQEEQDIYRLIRHVGLSIAKQWFCCASENRVNGAGGMGCSVYGSFG